MSNVVVVELMNLLCDVVAPPPVGLLTSAPDNRSFAQYCARSIAMFTDVDLH